MPVAIVAAVTLGVIAATYSAYSVYHSVKAKNGGYSPLEAWVKSRLHRRHLDRELDKILRRTDKR